MNDLYYDEDEQQEEEGIDIQKYIRIILKRKWLILTIALVISVPWVLYLKSLPPTYEAFCDIEFRSLDGGDKVLINESRIIKLRSRTFAERVVAQLGLTLNIEQNKHGVNRHKLFEVFKTSLDPSDGQYIFRWDNSNTYTIHRIDEQTGEEVIIKEGSIEDAQKELQKTKADFEFLLPQDMDHLPQEIPFNISMFKYAVKDFRSNTQVGFAGPNILRLTMTDTDPVIVTQMVNQLAEIYVKENKSITLGSIEERRQLIQDKLRIAEQNLQKSQKKMEDFQRTKIISLSAQTTKRAEELQEAEDNVLELKQNLEDLDELLKKIKPANDTKEEKERIKYVYQQLPKLPAFEKNYKMSALATQLGDRTTEYNETITGGLTRRSKKAKELESEIFNLHDEIKAEAISHRKEIKNEIAQLNRTIANLKYKLKEQLPKEQLELMEIKRELEANEAIYTELNTQLNVASLSEAVETESVEILDKAIVPDFPVNRTKKKKAIIGVAFAFFLGFAFAFGLEFLDKSIKTVDDVKRYLKLNVLGTIPALEFKDLGDHQDTEKIKMIDQQLVTYDYSPTPIGEAYRSLRTNLVFSKKAGRIQTLVLTSTAPGDGKSFTAANLAISIAQHKNSTLLIDADLRRGVLHNTYGVPKEPGFTNYLTGTATFSQVVNETLIPNLCLISCGSLLPNPSELLGSHQMKRFLDEAKRKFDHIIFDSPPLNAATDAIVIGTQVDTTVIVIRSGVTNRNMAKQKLELFKNVPANVMGAILNGTSAEFGHDGYSYYQY